jgi:hypothetical protein
VKDKMGSPDGRLAEADTDFGLRRLTSREINTPTFSAFSDPTSSCLLKNFPLLIPLLPLFL